MTLGVDGEEKKMYEQKPIPSIEKDPLAPKLEEEEINTSSSFVFMQTPAEPPKKMPVTKTEPVHFDLFAQQEERPKKSETQNGNVQAKPSPGHEIKHTEKKVVVEQKSSKSF
jgi:hypothetical protein